MTTATSYWPRTHLYELQRVFGGFFGGVIFGQPVVMVHFEA
jgi:hypothetical protein